MNITTLARCLKMADVKEQKIIEYFNEVWKKNTGKEYDEISYPFARQDTWTGKVVMDFAKFILAKEEEKTKQRVDQVLQEIEKEKEKSGRLSLVALTEEEKKYAYGMATAFQRAENLIKKAFEGVRDG